MISFFISLILSLASTANASLELTGFKLIDDTESARVYQLRDSQIYHISKERFTSQSAAESFCPAGSQLSNDAYLFSISGAPRFDAFIAEAIQFNFAGTTGIWWWSTEPSAKGDVVLMEGSRTTVVHFDALNKAASAAQEGPLSLSAICIEH